MRRCQSKTCALKWPAIGASAVEFGLILPMFFITFFLTLMFNVGELRCQDKTDGVQAKYQTESMEKSNLDEDESGLKKDKHIRFKMLVWLIRNNLMNRYQTLDEEELAEKLD